MKIFRLLSLVILAGLIMVAPANAYNPPPASIFALTFCPFTTCVITDPLPPDTPVNPTFQGQIIEIDLPPSLIMMPSQLIFPNSSLVYNFSGGKFIPPNNNPYTKHKVSTSLFDGNSDGASYHIYITGWAKDELPAVKDFRLTFVQPVTKDKIDRVAKFLGNPNSKAIDTARLTGAGCTSGDAYICLDTVIKVRVYGQPLPDSHLHQTIATKGIFVEGNIGAPSGALQNFSLVGNAIAVGQTIVNVNGGQAISGYPTSASSTINWASVSTTLEDIYKKRSSSPAITNLTNYQGSTWNLNSTNNDIANPAATTFSTPPEGKLWNIVVSGSSFDLGTGTSGTNFYGSGTIVLTGDKGQDVTLNVHENLTCNTNTRLGIITKGSINFITSTSTKESKVDCGAFVSLNGNIFFDTNNQAVAGTMNGIFIAKGNIALPDPNRLTGVYNIKRDNYFATHPTVLFADLLKAVFSS